MSVIIPELSFTDAISQRFSQVVNCEGYTQIGYTCVSGYAGADVQLYVSFDGETFYALTSLAMPSANQVYTSTTNITFKYCRLGINNSGSSTQNFFSIQSFFFESTLIENITTGGTGVTQITSSGIISITNPTGPTVDLSMSAASGASSGYLTASDWNTFNIKVGSLTAGAGISLSGPSSSPTITNSLPDQVITLTAGSNINISGSYPSFTIASTASSTERCILGGQGNLTGSVSRRFIGMWNDYRQGDTGTESEVQLIMPIAGTISTLYIKSETALGAGSTRTFRMRKNGVSQSLQAALTGAVDTVTSDLINSFTVVAGDLICFSYIDTGTAVSGQRYTSFSMIFTF